MQPTDFQDTVDVVVPMRNGARTVLATLTTVLAQTVQPRRIIVVDDGSDDDGASLIRDLPSVEVIRTPALGVSHARNIGIKASRADYIAFLDCDDLWRPDKLQRQLEIATQEPGAAVILCGQAAVQMDGPVVPWTTITPTFTGAVFEQLLAACWESGGWCSSMLVRRDALLRCGGFDEELQFGEDVDLCLRLARHHAFASCAECLTFIRENPHSTSRRQNSAEWHLEVALQHMTVIEKWITNRGMLEPVFRQCASVMLKSIVRGPLKYERLQAFRCELLKRAPKLGAKVAPNAPHFLFWLALFGALQIRKNAIAILRHRSKIRSKTKRQFQNGHDLPPS